MILRCGPSYWTANVDAKRYNSEMDFTPDPATAYHEAGHAVMALTLDRPIHQVSIIPGRQFLGICKFQKGVNRSCDDLLEREVLIALAGLAAEARHTGTYDHVGAGRDLRLVRDLARQRVGDRQVERFERRMLSKAENILADDGCWKAVELIAAELLKLGMISGRTARHLYEQGSREC